MSAFRTHGRGHLNGPVVVLGSGLLGTSIGLGLRGRGVAVFLSDPSPTNQAVAVDIGAGLPLARLEGEAAGARRRGRAAGCHGGRRGQGAPGLPARRRGGHREREGAASWPISAAAARTWAATWGPTPWPGARNPGPVAARGELFTSMPWVVCPAEETLPESLRVARALAGDLGAVVSEFAADEHDAAVALVSHLPQVMSSLVASRLQGTPLHALSLAGNGLRDVTRIAASDPTLWVQILGANAEKVVEILHGVREDLNRLIGTLEAPTAPGARLDLAQLISEGNAGQSRIPGKHGGPPQAYSWLTVLVDDTPGQIAKLLTEIGEIGVNVEDLRLDHSSGQNVGMVEISVLPNKHDLLIEALNDRGWRVLQ